MADSNTLTPSRPWFTVGTGNTDESGISLTTQRTALNEQVNLLANDIKTQNTSLITALTALLAAVS